MSRGDRPRERTRVDPLREKIITHNPKRLAMAEAHARSAPFGRGDLVKVWPSRGESIVGLCVDIIETHLYGRIVLVLAGGRVHRFEAERVSRA